MATWMYAGTSVRRSRERRAAMLSHRRSGSGPTPAFRLPRREAPALPPLEPEEVVAHTAPLPRPVVRLQLIQLRPLTPYAVRLTACPFLENRSRARHCLALEPREVTPACQAAVCLGQQHRNCPRYRQARGLRPLPPQRLAAYTVAIALVLTIIAVAGWQAARDDPGPSGPGESSIVR